MFNSKYYIYLIVSIFLALGLGIMIGVALENKNIIEDQQASLIKQIEDNILLYRSETESLKDSIKTMELENKVLYDVFDKLVTEVSYNQLLGTSVGLVCFDEELDIEYVKQLLEHTGAFIKT
ncbi:MAG: copper transporter, partial [Eubacteriales bacterium]